MSLLSRLGPPPNNPPDSSLLASPQVTGQEEGSEVATLDQDSCLKDPSAGSKTKSSRECVQDSVSEDNQSPLAAEQGKRQPRGDDRPKDVQHEEKQAQDSHGGLQEAGASRRPGPTTDQEQPQTQGSSGPLQDKPASDKTRKPRRKKRKPNPESESAELLTPYLDLFKPGEGQRSLHDEILAYERYISSTAAESALRNRVRARIERVVCWCFRDARIHVYGSSATGLCMPNGDIDLVVHTRRANTEGAKKSVLFQLRNALLNDGVAKEAYVVTNARHLVMNVTTSDDTGSYKVDISVNSTEGTSQLDIVREYLNTIPALRPLVLVVKGLLLQHGLGAATSAGLSSYVVMCMAINFLQLNPTQLSEDHIRQPIENRALGELFVRFLKYYADDFPYTTSYISVRENAVLPKVAKGWPPRKQEDALSIECLVDPENDIARAAQRMLQARELFRKTHDALRSVGQEGQADSGLPAVLGVSKELVEYRARIEALNRDAEQRATYPSLSGYTSSSSRYDYRNSRGASSSYSRGDSYRPPSGRYETGYAGSSYRDTRGPERNPGRYQPRDEYDIRGYHAMRETRR